VRPFLRQQLRMKELHATPQLAPLDAKPRTRKF